MGDFNYNAEKSKAYAARREKLDRAQHVHDTRVAAARLDLEQHTLAYQRQLDAWLEERIAALRQEVEGRLRGAYPVAYAAYDTAVRMAEEMRLQDTEEAEAVMADFMAQAEAARKAAKVEKWKASPAGQKAAAEWAEIRRKQAVEREHALETGEYPSELWHWWVKAEDAVGTGDWARQRWAESADYREQYLQRWPHQRAMIESEDRAGYDAWVAAGRPK